MRRRGNDWQMRVGSRAVLLALTVSLTMALPAVAAPEVAKRFVPQQSVGGVKIGMIASQVLAAAGKPTSNKITAHPLVGKTREMKFGLLTVTFRGTAKSATVFNVTTTSKKERSGAGVGVGSSEKQLAASLVGETCVTELGHRHCYLGKWKKSFVVTDFSISERGRVTQITLSVVLG